MTNIVAGDVTYSGFAGKDKQFLGRLGYLARGTATFGNGSLTYPTGGVPLTKAKMGCPRVLKSCKVLETNAKGLLVEFDVSAEKLRLFWSAGFTPSGNVAAPAGNLTAKALTLEAATGNVANGALTMQAPTISLGLGTGSNVNANLLIGISTGANAGALVGATNSLIGITGVQASTGNVANVQLTLQAATGNVANAHLTIAAPAFTGDAVVAAVSAELSGGSSVVPSTIVCELEVLGY
jgi:hypothetical protein